MRRRASRRPWPQPPASRPAGDGRPGRRRSDGRTGCARGRARTPCRAWPAMRRPVRGRWPGGRARWPPSHAPVGRSSPDPACRRCPRSPAAGPGRDRHRPPGGARGTAVATVHAVIARYPDEDTTRAKSWSATPAGQSPSTRRSVVDECPGRRADSDGGEYGRQPVRDLRQPEPVGQHQGQGRGRGAGSPWSPNSRETADRWSSASASSHPSSSSSASSSTPVVRPMTSRRPRSNMSMSSASITVRSRGRGVDGR